MTEGNDIPVKRALISVADKTNLTEFAKRLEALRIEIVSTGGTASYLRDQGVTVTPVSELTGFPEILEGRVKTLHPAIHGAILANLGHENTREALSTHGIDPIGLVVITLYPFEEAARKHADGFETMIEQIDIGGCALLRAAAKNHAFVTAVSSADDYGRVADDLDKHTGAVSPALRRALAAKAFARTAAYDAAIASWFAEIAGETPRTSYHLSGTLKEALRYGENPHQSAALYAANEVGPSVVNAGQVQGKPLSYNNLVDADAAFELISTFGAARPAAAIIKHANPCGVAQADTLAEAYGKAFACDQASAFGGVVAFNRDLDAEAADEVLKIFTEVVLAPSATAEAKRMFAAKPNIRLLLMGGLLTEANRRPQVRSVSGGFLVQDADVDDLDIASIRPVTRRTPSEKENIDLIFAMRAAKFVRSNAIVFAKGEATAGIGAGQMSRVDSVRIAVMKAKETARAAGHDPANALAGTVVASDAFFPFADGLIAAADAGATAVIQPGGSMRDQDVIDAADARGLAMVFTGVRHFRH